MARAAPMSRFGPPLAGEPRHAVHNVAAKCGQDRGGIRAARGRPGPWLRLRSSAGGDEVERCAGGYQWLALHASLELGEDPGEVSECPGMQVPGLIRLALFRVNNQIDGKEKPSGSAGSAMYFCRTIGSLKFFHLTPYRCSPFQ